MAELKPCPFCGHDAVLYNRFGYVFIGCHSCHSSIRFSDVENDNNKTIERYNTRTPQKIEHNSLCETETYEVGE